MTSRLPNLIKAVSGLLRVFTYILLLLYLGLGFVYGVYDSGGHLGQALSSHRLILLLASLIIAAWYINGTALNDYADYEIDQVNLANDPGRPLVTGMLDKTGLLRVAGVAALIAVLAAIPLGALSFAVVICLLLLNAAYSIKPVQISRRGGVAPALLPLGYVALPLTLGAAISTTHFHQSFYVILAAAYLQFTSRILLKDYRDVKGDAKFGKRTFLLKYGSTRVCQYATAALIASVIIFAAGFPGLIVVTIYPTVVLASFAAALLQNLAAAKGWPRQRPIITAYGRACSGVLVLMILTFLLKVEAIQLWRQILLAAVTGSLFIWTSIDILRS